MAMIESENKMFASLDSWGSAQTREQKRLKALSEFSLRRLETIPIFEEATQTAAHFLAAEISILGFIDRDLHWFKSSVGLSRLGLMNELAQNRQISRRESFCNQVVETSQTLVINDTHNTSYAGISTTKLVQSYGIRSYLGAPLIDAEGNCLGTLAVMDRKPRSFTERDIEFLQIIARWSMSEFERNWLMQQNVESDMRKSQVSPSINTEYTVDLNISLPTRETTFDSTKPIKLELLHQLTQELRTPLTSVLGMASVLAREIYGPLTTKQREYLEIIQHSGKYLLSLMNEITELGIMNTNTEVLDIAPVNLEMLCQQAINTLEEIANRREQDIRLSIEPGHSRILSLDKDKVRQMVYHLVFSVMQLSPTGSIIRIHNSFKENSLCIAVWVSHPWLGTSMTEVDPYGCLPSLSPLEMVDELSQNVITHTPENQDILLTMFDKTLELTGDDSGIRSVNLLDNSGNLSRNLPREKLSLLLSCYLAKLHGGDISIQGSSASGYRYILSLPQGGATIAQSEETDDSKEMVGVRGQELDGVY
jgi:GAF domain-containing protein